MITNQLYNVAMCIIVSILITDQYMYNDFCQLLMQLCSLNWSNNDCIESLYHGF